jgi:hypothetical protein
MATFTWTAQLTTGTLTIGATDKVGFYGTNFGDAITVNSYQDSTHIENSSGTHQCTTNHVHNTKYLTSTTVSIDGGASQTLGASVPTTAQCPLKINFSDASSVATSNGKFWADNGSDTATAPTDVTFKAGEQSNTSWTSAAPKSNAVSLANQAAATSHDFYIFCSASPTAVGDKTAFRLGIELTYQ